MATDVIMPKLGLTMVSGKIAAWHKKEGDGVKRGDVLCEVESDKSVNEVTAPAAGNLLKIVRRAGETAPVLSRIAVLGSPGESVPDEADPASPAGKERTEAAAPGKPVPAEPAGKRGRVVASPLARKAAKEFGIDLRTITPPNGQRRIRFGDVQARMAESPSPAPGGIGGETAIRPMSGMRKTIADRMRASLGANAQAWHRITVDMTEARRARAAFPKGTVSLNGLVCFAVCRALGDNPAINVELTDAGIVEKRFVNLGVAVAIDAGLIVPVVRNAHAMRLAELSEGVRILVETARSGGLSPDDYRGGTFTVSNLGACGLEEFDAIINPPESAILAVGAIADAPAVANGSLCVRPLMRLSLGYDHRVIDGAPAAVFIMRVKELLENPWLML